MRVQTVKTYDALNVAIADRAQRKQGNPRSRQKYVYKDLVSAFDIETSVINTPDGLQAILYLWQWQIGEETVIGRTWDEFHEAVRIICDRLEEDERLVVFVHNLSYEFQFLKGQYPFEASEVFAVDKRKVLKCTMYNKLEFRCSYLHSNASLEVFLKNMGVKHQKVKGFDYTKVRYPWTPLSEDELLYGVNDVRGLVEALEIEMDHDGDNLYTLPLTSTGYVRRDAKRAMRMVSHWYIKDQEIDYPLYKLLREAFRGGNTHANRFFAGQIMHDVHSADRSSSYPDTQCNDRFPVSAFYRAGDQTAAQMRHLIHDRGRAVVCRMAVTNIRLRDPFWGCPYLSRDKCRNVIEGEYDNGRILEARYLETSVTDIDLGILESEYEWDSIDFFDVYHARYGPLPRPLVQATIDYYHAKTELKNVQGEELNYMRSKAKLNSIYGMMAQDPVKFDIIYRDGLLEQDTSTEAPDILAKHNKRAFLLYQWGVWVTAWARLRLEEGIRLAEREHGFVYADTDSVKYIGDVDWSSYNRIREQASQKSGAWADDPSGTRHYMGVFEWEGTYSEFCTLGAKKYVYKETPDGPLHITIAGVNKKEGAKELEAAGGIRAFKPGFVFRAGGGLDAIYNDFPELDHVEISGHKVDISTNVVLYPGEYTLGITGEYDRLIKLSQKMLTGCYTCDTLDTSPEGLAKLQKYNKK